VIDDINEQLAVEAVNAVRFKVVRIINFCGMPGMNFIGCAGVGGATATVVRRTDLATEGILWVHEYGHNVGLVHHGDGRYIMNGTNTGSNNALDANDCDTYHNPNVFSFADMIETGPCIEPACGNGTCDFGEDCNNCSVDCISSSGFSCGNGICEAGDGEDCVSCDLDCRGKQNGNPENRFCCGDGDGENPLPCSDPVCTASGYQCTDVPNTPYCCGDLTCEGDETNLNCAVDCGDPVWTAWAYFGSAQGGTIDLTISAVPLQVVTSAGQSTVQVAASVAAAINNDPTLAGMGVTAQAVGNQVRTTGSHDSQTVNDAGLSYSLVQVPALPRRGLLLAFLLPISSKRTGRSAAGGGIPIHRRGTAQPDLRRPSRSSLAYPHSHAPAWKRSAPNLEFRGPNAIPNRRAPPGRVPNQELPAPLRGPAAP
jgi:hypothetical protein